MTCLEVQGKAGRPVHSLKHMDEGESDSIWGMGVGGLYRAYRLMDLGFTWGESLIHWRV